MPQRLRDDDPEKWVYHSHTRAKHNLLGRYLKGWIPILARAAGQRRQARVRLSITDAFAGRGRYEGGEEGSPLVIAQVAHELAKYFAEHPIGETKVEVVCSFIEANQDNCIALSEEVAKRRADVHPNVTLRDPMETTFTKGIGPILEEAHSTNAPLFVFIDPFGYAGIPLRAMTAIMQLPQAEVFITFMARDINRFFDQTDRDDAFCHLLGLSQKALNELRDHFQRMPNREQELIDYYMDRLKKKTEAEFTFPFKVWPEHGHSTIYYLVHASKHARALRLMKESMKSEGTHGEYAFFGAKDFGRRLQNLLIPLEDESQLKLHLLKKFAGRTLGYDPDLLNAVAPDDEVYYFTDRHVKRVLQELRAEGKVAFRRDGAESTRALMRRDRVKFPNDVPGVQVGLKL